MGIILLKYNNPFFFPFSPCMLPKTFYILYIYLLKIGRTSKLEKHIAGTYRQLKKMLILKNHLKKNDNTEEFFAILSKQI